MIYSLGDAEDMINKELLKQFGSDIKKMQESLLKFAEFQQCQIRQTTRSIQKILDKIDF